MEHDFHNWLRNHTSIQGMEKGVLLGIGDDGAILPESSSHTVVTTDTIAEGTHFDTSIHSLEQIGRKAIAVNLSDIAAMGATPTHAVLTLLMMLLALFFSLRLVNSEVMRPAARLKSLLWSGFVLMVVEM